ncbi:MAG: SCO family protein [Parvularculaceae bacterium]|nr:SCO family protein [Parvularculaceae bacterium]
MQPNRLTGMIAAAAFALLASCGGAQESNLPEKGVIRLSDQFSADFALVDQDGRLVRDEDFKGKVAIVYFGFATCPDVCPLALGRLSAALNALTEGERRDIAALFITVDPERDTPEALKSYLAFDPRITGLTGDRGAIDQAKSGFKVYAEPEPLPDSSIGYTMNHSSLFYLIDRKGALKYALEDTLSPDQIAASIRSAL